MNAAHLLACSKHSSTAVHLSALTCTMQPAFTPVTHLSEEMRLLRPACQAFQTCHVESDAEEQAPGRPKLWTCISTSPRPGESAVTACTAA